MESQYDSTIQTQSIRVLPLSRQRILRPHLTMKHHCHFDCLLSLGTCCCDTNAASKQKLITLLSDNAPSMKLAAFISARTHSSELVFVAKVDFLDTTPISSSRVSLRVMYPPPFAKKRWDRFISKARLPRVRLLFIKGWYRAPTTGSGQVV